MHRLIMGVEDPKLQVDHKNHNGLDNRRDNLRLCTDKQNKANLRKSSIPSASIYKGVRFFKNRRKCWNAYINDYGSIGYYCTEQAAAIAYNLKALELHGEFAYLNQIQNLDEAILQYLEDERTRRVYS